MSQLRSWQRRALVHYLSTKPDDYLAVATPGAGKTAFALRVATELLTEGSISSISVVTPTEHLKVQWARAAARTGIPLDPTFRNSEGVTSREFRGIVVTYAQVGLAPQLHARRTMTSPTLVIFDELHHAGDSRTWGDGVRQAFGHAARRLALTGTPFRSDTNPIPFVTYTKGADGLTRSAADISYGYGEALRDGIVRPVVFMAYSGEARWRTRAGDEMAARLGEPLTVEQTARAWRTALDPAGDWIRQVLSAADARLTVVRREGMHDAGGLVIASDHTSAKAYARLLADVTGTQPVVVLSDDAGASKKITDFTHSSDRWMIAVRMVSEGVDIPRLAVGVYATSTATPLFFAQAIGRFVRARRPGETATVFVPSVPPLLELASSLEEERDHILDRPHREQLLDDASLLDANKEKTESDEAEKAFTALSADAELDHVIYDGASFGTPVRAGTPEEEDYLGLPGLLTPEQMSLLLTKRQAEQARAHKTSQPKPATDDKSPSSSAEPTELFEQRAALRRQLHNLVGAYHRRTGKPHSHIHAELRRIVGGPSAARATLEQLTERIAVIRSW